MCVVFFLKDPPIQIAPDYCPTSPHKFHPYRGKKSLQKSAIVEHNKGMLTAVTAMPYYNHTVVFIGTGQGQLLKV